MAGSAPSTARPRRSLPRHLYALVAEAFLALVLVTAAGPFLLVLPLRWADPPATAVMVARYLERRAAGTDPAWPRREPVPLARISPHLRRAVVAAEDDRFYEHRGFDLGEIADALEAYERGRRLRGASTITQQVAKNLFLWEGRSFARKALEAWFTVVLEACLPKDRILEIYLNAAEWGDGVFGAEAAARAHFRKSAADLTADEGARLAAILPSPRRWRVDGPYARRRADEILGRFRPRPAADTAPVASPPPDAPPETAAAETAP